MKRSQKLTQDARYSLAMAALTAMSTIAVACWVPSAWMTHPALGFVLGALAITGAILAVAIFADGLRLIRLASDEERYEHARSVRQATTL